MTWNEAATGIAAKIGREFDIPFKLILVDDLKVWRSRLLKDTLERDARQISQFYQTVYAPIEVAPVVDCIPEGVLCTSYRTAIEIPLPVRSSSGLFDYVGSVDGKTPYRVASGGTGSFLTGGRYSHKARFYDYSNLRILLSHNPRVIMIRHAFDDPTKIIQCSSSGEVLTDCDPLDAQIPATGDVIQKMQQYVLSYTLQRPDLAQNAPNESTGSQP